MRAFCTAFLISLFLPLAAQAAPLRTLPGLIEVGFVERTTTDQTIAFTPPSGALLSRRSGQLQSGNTDFARLSGTAEAYDVFYSRADGTPDLFGEYLTIEANATAPGALNMVAVFLDFGLGGRRYADVLASFVGIGPSYSAGSEINVLGNNAANTTMGSSIDPNNRLRLTVGFSDFISPKAVPVPAAAGLVAFGLAALLRRKRPV